MIGVVGAIAIETRAAALTVSVAEALTESEEMPITVGPIPTVVARPCVPAELLIVATFASVELQ